MHDCGLDHCHWRMKRGGAEMRNTMLVNLGSVSSREDDPL